MFDYINEQNFLFYAAKFYSNPQCYSEDEFKEDLDRFKYLKRLFNRYVETGDLKERLILNHLIPLYNVFEVEPCTRMLFWKLRGFEKQLKPFLMLLGYLPETIKGVGDKSNIIRTVDISLDKEVVNILRNI